jgi:hypothetical protein
VLVRLTAKLANVVNGLDVTQCEEGDVIDVADRDGQMLVAERWAKPVSREEAIRCPKRPDRAVAADKGQRGSSKAEWADHSFDIMNSARPDSEK